MAMFFNSGERNVLVLSGVLFIGIVTLVRRALFLQRKALSLTYAVPSH